MNYLEEYEGPFELNLPEIDNPDHYNINWNYLYYFNHLIDNFDDEFTFGNISLAKIKILELENKITNQKKEIYFNLVNTFIDHKYCESNRKWKNYKIKINDSNSLSDYYKKEEDTTEIEGKSLITVYYTEPDNLTNTVMPNEFDCESEPDFIDYKEEFLEKINKIKNKTDYKKYDDLSNDSKVFRSALNNVNKCLDAEKMTSYFVYVFCFVWLKDLLVWFKRLCELTENNPKIMKEFIQENIYNKRTLLINNYSYDQNNLHYELQDYILENLSVLDKSDIIKKRIYKFTKLMAYTFVNYINNGEIQNPVLDPYEPEPNNDFLLTFMMSKIDEIKEYEYIEDKYYIQNSFVYFHNNGIEGIKKEIDLFIKENLNDENIEFQLPDIYILTGVNFNIQELQRNVYKNYNFISSTCIDNLNNFLGYSAWYYVFSLICFISQIIGPIYYVFEYMLNEENDYCPNRSDISTKLFSMCYYLLLYTQFSNMCEEISFMCYLYDTTNVVNCKYTLLSWIINNLCLLIIPFFTYTLFIEHNSLTDLILNCLTGQFLINIDNIVVTFYSGNFFLKNLLKDKILLSYLEKGINLKNVMQEDSSFITAFTILGIIQSYITLILAVVIGGCI